MSVSNVISLSSRTATAAGTFDDIFVDSKVGLEWIRKVQLQNQKALGTMIEKARLFNNMPAVNDEKCVKMLHKRLDWSIDVCSLLSFVIILAIVILLTKYFKNYVESQFDNPLFEELQSCPC